MPFPFRLRSGPATPTAPVALRRVHLIDTSVASDNVGDEVIVDSARPYLTPLLGGAYVTTSSGHDGLGPFGRPSVEAAEVVFLLGTNALAPFDQMARKRFIWMIRPEDLEAYEGKVVLVGVGANRAFDRVDPAQRKLLRRLLSPRFTHSVRDGLALRILEEVGVSGVNTSCPTLWRFAESQPQVARDKAPAVCFTLTMHKADPADRKMVEILLHSYDRVHFWPQQPRDLDYLASLTDLSRIHVLAPNLAAYDALLRAGGIDVVGTRLHGCIRGLQNGCRSLAIAIDNRAMEIGAETGLPTLPREAVARDLAARLADAIETRLEIPGAEIARFLGQFQPG